MKVITEYRNITQPSLSQAQEDYENEYYNTPHGVGNAYLLRYFKKEDGKILRGRTDRDMKGFDDYYLKKVVTAILNVAEKGTFGDNTIYIGGGYNYWTKDNRVVAEGYVACSGNMCFVIHGDDKTTMYVDSRRHGIPALAMEYARDYGIGSVTFYESFRKDRDWTDYGLAKNCTSGKPNKENK